METQKKTQQEQKKQVKLKRVMKEMKDNKTLRERRRKMTDKIRSKSYLNTETEKTVLSIEDRISNMLSTKETKHLTSLEEGKLYNLLKNNYGWSIKDISKKSGRSLPHVYKMISLANTPLVFRKFILNDEITANTVSTIMKSSNSINDAEKQIRTAINLAKKMGKKATAKHVQITANNSLDITKKVIAKLKEKGIGNNRIDVINDFINMYENQYLIEKDLVEYMKD